MAGGDKACVECAGRNACVTLDFIKLRLTREHIEPELAEKRGHPTTSGLQGMEFDDERATAMSLCVCVNSE